MHQTDAPQYYCNRLNLLFVMPKQPDTDGKSVRVEVWRDKQLLAVIWSKGKDLKYLAKQTFFYS